MLPPRCPMRWGGDAFRQVNSFAGMDRIWNRRNTEGTDHTEGASVVSEVSMESVVQEDEATDGSG
jgi:hypothetical protein